ncbi:peptidase S8/S53 domain-containing protein [Mycena galericulata]|nr:peptidase S8/S53 domain-containing protein [Mycena galericulata]
MASSFFTLALSLAAAVSSTPLSTSSFYPSTQRTPLTLASFHKEHQYGLINNSYIVMLKPDTPAAVMQNHFNFLQTAHETDPLVDDSFMIKHVYKRKGYAARLSDGAVNKLREMPEVDYIEQDQIVRIQDTQKSAPWGLARVSHRNKLTFGTFTRYEYERNGGEGVDVYVIDTGINIAHVEFQGRASWGKTIPANDVDEDGNGHGSHCAGTIASAKYGVAKAANVIAVKVLGSNGSGSMSDVVAGVTFAAESAQEKAKAAEAEVKATGKTSHKGSVANMSLGGGKSRALDDAVNAAVDTGLHFAVAAGNDNRDACSYSPAAAEKAVTVGASTLGDERAYFSNYGPCVDVFAPGLNILSTYTGSPTAVATLSGTSMASPHTAGMLAYLLSLYPSKTFNPEIEEMPLPAMMQLQRPFALALSSPTYMFVRAALPSWAASFLPTPRVGEDVVPLAPVPNNGTITPAQLKKALLDLASTGKLTDLPDKTVNLLIFNNATTA